MQIANAEKNKNKVIFFSLPRGATIPHNVRKNTNKS